MLQFFFAFLLCSTYCSAQSTAGNSTQSGDDKTNWEEMFKAMNASGMARIDEANLDIFETILRVNARERGTGLGRTDTDVFLFEGDIQVSKKEIFGSGYPNANRKRRALIRNSGNLWGRTIYYVLDRGLGGKARAAITSAIREWRDTLPCITWTDITGQNPEERSYMHFFVGGGCYSHVGRVGGGQKVSIGRGCDYHGIAVHEIGHAMGLWHEQSRPDRDSYVRINWQNIIPATRFNFQKQPVSRVDSLNVGYDYESVMHYGATAFAKASGLITIERLKGNAHQRHRLGQRVGLSAKDKLQVQRLYNCGTAATTSPPTTSPPTTLSPSGCRNKATDDNCERWTKAGFCKSDSKYYNYMKDNCCQSCSCEDASSHSKWCIESKKLSLCQDNLFKSYMEQHCCKTCQPTPPPTTRPTTGCRNKAADDNCERWTKAGFCKNDSKYYNYMKDNCCQSCSCEDASPHSKWCIESKKLSLCQNNLFKSYMEQHCCKTCQPTPLPTFRPTTGCRNKAADNNCERWRKAGFCRSGSQYYNYMKENCCKSCSIPCFDKVSYCAGWKRSGYCTQTYVKYMTLNCAKTCGHCLT